MTLLGFPASLVVLIVLQFILSTGAIADSNEAEISASEIKESVEPVLAEQLFASANCGKIYKSQWLSTQTTYEAAADIATATSQFFISASKPQLPTIYFATSAVVLISMGQQRTGGYSVKLATQQFKIKYKIMKISVQWLEPKLGMMTTQMLSNPCVFVEVPRGEYSSVEVVDQSGVTRLTIKAKQD